MTVKLFTDKKESKEKLAHLVTYAGKVRSGMVDEYLDDRRKRPLADHLADYQRHMEAKAIAQSMSRKLWRNAMLSWAVVDSSSIPT